MWEDREFIIMIVAGFMFVSVSAYLAGLVGSSNKINLASLTSARAISINCWAAIDCWPATARGSMPPNPTVSKASRTTLRCRRRNKPPPPVPGCPSIKLSSMDKSGARFSS